MLFQLLDAHLFDLRLPDLVSHPGQRPSPGRPQSKGAARGGGPAPGPRLRPSRTKLGGSPSPWTMEKVKCTKKGSHTRNVHLGSCTRMDVDAALQGRGPGNQDLNIEECGGEFRRNRTTTTITSTGAHPVLLLLMSNL